MGVSQLHLWHAERTMPTSSSGYYRGFTPDTPETVARASFRQRYGAEPAEVREAPGILLVGPVPAPKDMGRRR